MGTVSLDEVFGLTKLPTYIERVDDLMRSLPATASPTLRGPAERIINSGGKRLRPSLVFAVASLGNEEIDQSIIDAAAAIELVHLASLVHDDIIDASDERRGIPTVNKNEGVDAAILVGDYLVALAGVQASKVNSAVAGVVAEAFATMCDGQSLELADTHNLDRSVDSYMECIGKKTAALMGVACRVGGITAGLPKTKLAALENYGHAFGMAFQLTDDLLDILASNKTTGKPASNDIKEGVYTLPLLLGLKNGSGAELRKLIVNKSGQPSITQLLIKTGAVDATIAEIERYNQQAVASLRSLGDSRLLDGLRKLPAAYSTSVLKPLA